MKGTGNPTPDAAKKDTDAAGLVPAAAGAGPDTAKGGTIRTTTGPAAAQGISGTAQANPCMAQAVSCVAEAAPDARRQRVFDWLDSHGIAYTWYEHPEAPTIEIARRYWHDDGSKHCKNLFFRNHKGNRHYLVSFDCEQNLAIHDLEHRLRQGKLSFASEQRMERWLGLRPGSVSPFGLINDPERHVHLFLDANLQHLPAFSFHPNDNRATVVIAREEFLRYLAAVGNSYEFIELY